MLFQLEKHVSTVFYVGFVYVCVPRQYPETMLILEMLWFYLWDFLLLIYSLMIYIWV